MANKTMVMLLSPLEFFSFRVCVCVGSHVSILSFHGGFQGLNLGFQD